MVRMGDGGVGRGVIWKGLDLRGGLGEVGGSVVHGRAHRIHGNGLIILSVAVRPAALMVTEWTGCADDQRWGGE